MMNDMLHAQINWALTPYANGMTQMEERAWGNNIIGQSNNGNWTTKLAEHMVRDVLILRGENPRRPQRKDGYSPDWETDDYIYEVKTRNWTTSGTAGEKVLGTMYKYSDIPKIYEKPLKIVCVAYQEYELTNGTTRIFGEVSENKQRFLDLAKSMNIEYMKFSDLVKDLDLSSNCTQSPL